jgi:hypothetical protein
LGFWAADTARFNPSPRSASPVAMPWRGAGPHTNDGNHCVRGFVSAESFDIKSCRDLVRILNEEYVIHLTLDADRWAIIPCRMAKATSRPFQWPPIAKLECFVNSQPGGSHDQDHNSYGRGFRVSRRFAHRDDRSAEASSWAARCCFARFDSDLAITSGAQASEQVAQRHGLLSAFLLCHYPQNYRDRSRFIGYPADQCTWRA